MWSTMAAGTPAIVPEFQVAGKRKKGRAKETDFDMLIQVLLKLTITLSFGVRFQPTKSESLPHNIISPPAEGEKMKRTNLVCSVLTRVSI